MKRTFTTLASKLNRDNKVVQFAKNIFVSHDQINKYMAMTLSITAAGYVGLNQDIKDLKNDINGLKDLIIKNNQRRE